MPVVAGGGVALVRASELVKEKMEGEVSIGSKIILTACGAPLKQIVKNSGGVPELVFEKVSKVATSGEGYDASSERYGNMFEMGIIDPVKVVRSALENAASAAGMLLTAGCALVEEDKDCTSISI